MKSKVVAAFIAIALGLTMASTGALARGGHGGGGHGGGGHGGGGHSAGGGHPGGSSHFGGSFGGRVVIGRVNRTYGQLDHRFVGNRRFHGAPGRGPYYCYDTFPRYELFSRCYDDQW